MMAHKSTVIVAHVKQEEPDRSVITSTHGTVQDMIITPCSPTTSESAPTSTMTCSDPRTSDVLQRSASQSPKQLRLDLFSSDQVETVGSSTPASPSPTCVSPGNHQHICSSTTSDNYSGVYPTDRSNTQSGCEDERDYSSKRLCLVCGDVASGFHYGVASCEACKAFFKRTIQGNVEYTCLATMECEINKRRRKACQACRFRKCLLVGMLKEGVRLDRVRGGRQKYRRKSESLFVANNNNSFPSVQKSCHDDNKILSSLLQCEPDILVASPDPSIRDEDIRLVNTLSELMDKELVGTIGWAKQIPGFTDLSLNDQMRLLQSSWAEILCLSLAYRSMLPSDKSEDQEYKLKYANGMILDERQAQLCHAQEIFRASVNIINRLERIKIQREEYIMLKALLLTNPDVPVDDIDGVNRLKDNVLSSLYDCVAVTRVTSSNHLAIAGQLLLCMPLLRQINGMVRRYWTNIKNNGTVPMKKLFIEMLECQLR